MWALPPHWRKMTKRRLPLILVGGAVVVLSADLAFHVLKDVVGLVRSEPVQAHVPTPRAAPPAPRAAPPPQPSHPVADGPFVVKSILPISGPIKFGQYFWDESQGRPGPLVITVDLTARVLSVFEDGHEIGATAILKGYGEKQTPVGVFPITQKDAHHTSTIFDVPMPYMLRLTNDGVSIHGSKVERGYATNGCVGVPEPFAAKLFQVAHLGDKVIITDGKRLNLGDPIIARPKG